MKLTQNFSEIQKQANPGFKFQTGTLGDIVTNILPYVFSIAGILLLLYLLAGGLSFMTSGGDPKGLESAKSKITNALVGFLVIFAAYWVVKIVGLILGQNFL